MPSEGQSAHPACSDTAVSSLCSLAERWGALTSQQAAGMLAGDAAQAHCQATETASPLLGALEAACAPQVYSQRKDWHLSARVHILPAGQWQSAVSSPWQSAGVLSPASRRPACSLVMPLRRAAMWQALLNSLSPLSLQGCKDRHRAGHVASLASFREPQADCLQCNTKASSLYHFDSAHGWVISHQAVAC